jgi:hypothetical protein
MLWQRVVTASLITAAARGPELAVAQATEVAVARAVVMGTLAADTGLLAGKPYRRTA